jgi:hypothetical protein
MLELALLAKPAAASLLPFTTQLDGSPAVTKQCGVPLSVSELALIAGFARVRLLLVGEGLLSGCAHFAGFIVLKWVK